MKFKKLFLIMLLFIVTIGIASANDLNNTIDGNSQKIISDEPAEIYNTEIDYEDSLEEISQNTLSTNHSIEGNFEDIQKCIDNSSDDDIIFLKGEYNSGGKNITINKTLTFQGDRSACLNGNFNNLPIFIIESNDVILKNIHFKNVNSPHSGSAIYAKGYNITCINCTFENFLTNNFGTVYASEGIFKDCTFIKCNSHKSGAAIYFENYTANHIVDNCTFINCISQNYGGAIYNGNIYNSRFFNCLGATRGGAIYTFGNITNSIFNNCKATEYGGAIFTLGNIVNSTFNNCSSNEGGAVLTYGIIKDSTFNNCNATKLGGAVFGEGNIVNSTFNSCSSPRGGAIYNKGNITNSTFNNCKATAYGGAIYNKGNITNSTFNSCSSPRGGAIYNGQIDNSYFFNCTSEYGGAIYGPSATNCTFEICSASKKGSAVYGNAYNCTFKNFLDQELSTMVSGEIINPTDIIEFEKKNATIQVVLPERIGDFYDPSGREWSDFIFLYYNPEIVGNATIYIDGIAKYTKRIEKPYYYEGGEEPDIFCTIGDLGSLSYGKHTWEIRYGGNRIYNPTSQSGTFTYTYMYIEFEKVILEKYPYIQLCLPEEAGYIKFSIDGKQIHSSKYFRQAYIMGDLVEMDFFLLEIPDISYGKHTYTIQHTGGNARHPGMTESGEFQYGYDFFPDAYNYRTTYGNNVTVKVTLPSDAKNNIEAYINGKKISKISKDEKSNTYTINVCDMNIGDNVLTVNYLGDIKYPFSSRNISVYLSLEVIGPKSISYDEKGVVSLKLPEDANGSLVVKIDNVVYESSKLINGEASITLPAIGFTSRLLDAMYNGTDYKVKGLYKNIDGIPKIYVPKEMTAKSKEYITFEVPSDADGKLDILVFIGDVKYTFKDGKAKVDLSSLPADEYDVVIIYSGDSKYSDYEVSFDLVVHSLDPKIKFQIPDKILMNTKTTITVTCDNNFKNDIQFYSTNNIIQGSKPKNGKITLTFTPKKYGTHTIYWSCDDEYYGFHEGRIKFKVLPKGIILSSKLSKAYTSSSLFKVRVYDGKGNIVSGKYVTFKVNGKKVARVKTNSKGYASYKLTKAPGTYKISATWNGVVLTKNFKIKKILSLKKVAVKKSAKKLVLTATLEKVDGKYLKGKRITFKFNGKKYSAKTNKKGIAKVTVKKSVLKKLNVGKKIIYSANYKKDSVKKTVKIKK